MHTEDNIQIVKKLEASLHEKEAEMNALQEEIAGLKQREDQFIALQHAQLEELQDLRELAQAVRKHFNNNLGVERCVACSKCDYEELEKALFKCKLFTHIRL